MEMPPCKIISHKLTNHRTRAINLVCRDEDRGLVQALRQRSRLGPRDFGTHLSRVRIADGLLVDVGRGRGKLLEGFRGRDGGGGGYPIIGFCCREDAGDQGATW